MSVRPFSVRCGRSRRPTRTTLYGVFGDAQWSNKERLSDALLKDLIEHFSKLPFGNRNINSDLLGDAYEYLIKKFADTTNKKAGEFYTPRSVVRLMIDMLDPKETETIYDPACGTSGMLLAAVHHVKEMHGDVKRLWGKLYGHTGKVRHDNQRARVFRAATSPGQHGQLPQESPHLRAAGSLVRLQVLCGTWTLIPSSHSDARTTSELARTATSSDGAASSSDIRRKARIWSRCR